MAENLTDEGLDYMLGVLFKGGTVDTTLYLGLFTSASASTVPARTATGGASPSGWTEMSASSGSYARIAIATGDWGSAATNGSGRRISLSSAKQFTGFVGAAAANGYFIATNSASGAGDTIIGFSNFDSGVARTFATTSDQLNVTPRIQLDI
jgi:hypothetical protein